MENTHPNVAPVCRTVYSMVWPSTENLVRRVLVDQAEQLLDLHRDAHTKRQDQMHEGFFDAWRHFAAPVLNLSPDFTEQYPTAGSSEASVPTAPPNWTTSARSPAACRRSS